jgi:hypothetical protein
MWDVAELPQSRHFVLAAVFCTKLVQTVEAEIARTTLPSRTSLGLFLTAGTLRGFDSRRLHIWPA